MTTLRIALCPARKPALMARLPSRRFNQSPNDDQFHSQPAASASTGMPSTRPSMRMM